MTINKKVRILLVEAGVLDNPERRRNLDELLENNEHDELNKAYQNERIMHLQRIKQIIEDQEQDLSASLGFIVGRVKLAVLSHSQQESGFPQHETAVGRYDAGSDWIPPEEPLHRLH